MVVNSKDQYRETLSETFAYLVLKELEVEAIVLNPSQSGKEFSTFENSFIEFMVPFNMLDGKSHQKIVLDITFGFLLPGAISLARQLDKINKSGKPVEFYVPSVENVLDAFFTNEKISIINYRSEAARTCKIDIFFREWTR